MAIAIREYQAQQEYMLQKMIAEKVVDPNEARKMWHALEREMQRRKVSLEDWQDNLAPVDMYKKFAEMEAHANAKQLKAKIKAVQDSLAQPHMQCTLSAAVNLWIVKFGDGWVRVNDMPNEPHGSGEMNWNKLLTRLADTHKVEKYEDYVRIIT